MFRYYKDLLKLQKKKKKFTYKKIKIGTVSEVLGLPATLGLGLDNATITVVLAVPTDELTTFNISSSDELVCYNYTKYYYLN